MKLRTGTGWTLHQGDVRRVAPVLPAESVDCIVTSPPYWQLRDYGHRKQLGLEASVGRYVGNLVRVFRELRRVLKSEGTLWLNLGDTYIGGRNGGIGSSSITSQRNQIAARAATGGSSHRSGPGLKPKDLVGIPWRVAFALQNDGWWLRSDVVWHKPSPMPESVKDRPTRAHEYLFLLSKSETYHYDADAIMEPVTGGARPRGCGVNPKAAASEGSGSKQNASWAAAVRGLVERRNRRSVWTVPQEPIADAHFATFPRALVRPCILAGCPRGGVVLDPFGGLCTTGVEAIAQGRRFEGVELVPEYAARGAEILTQAVADAGNATPADAAHARGDLQFGLFPEVV